MRMKINCNNINPHFSEIINPADRRERTTDAAMHTKAYKTDIVISFEKPFGRRFIHKVLLLTLQCHITKYLVAL